MFRRSRNKSTGFNDPEKGFDSTAKRTVTLIIVLILVVMVAVYFVITYKYGSLSNMFLGETTVSDTKESTTEHTIKKATGAKNILISMNSSGESNLYNIFLVRLDYTNAETHIISIPTYTLDTNNKTLAEEFSLGGVTQVEYMVEKMFDVTIDKYLSATQNGYKYLLKQIGDGVDYNLPEDVQFSTTDFSLSLSQGKQTLSFDSFAKLMRYDGWSGGDGVTFKRQGELMKSAYTQLFKAKSVSRDVDKFSDMMSYVKSDISSEDFINDLDAVEYAASSDFSVTVVTPEGTFGGTAANKTFSCSKSSVSSISKAFNTKVQTK